MVGGITEALLNSGWRDEGDFQFSPCTDSSTGSARDVQEFLRILMSHVDPHLQLRENRLAHYEDLYAAAMQIFQDEICELVDPMLRHSVSEISFRAENLYKNYEAGNYPSPFARLVHGATLLILWGVFHMLSSAEVPTGMDVLAATAKATSQMDVFSLNHDLLIEHLFEQNKIAFADGFSERTGDVLRFNWSWKDSAVRLYKLHGSINWYRYGYPGGIFQFAKIPPKVDPRNCKDSEGEDLYLTNPTPLFLTGTNGKERLYGVGFVNEFFNEFRLRKADHHTIICCGYGWADHGINSRISQWLFNLRENRIVILHNGNSDELPQKRIWSRGDRWNQYVREGKIILIPKWLSECTLADLEPFFEN